MSELLQRINAIHAWYQRNVLNMRQTPEVERLWLEWFRAGYNGHDLRDVIRYIRKQIALGKRNEGALKLSNLLARSEAGFLKFDEDLALSRARGNLRPDRVLEAAPGDGVQTSASAPAPVAPAPGAPKVKLTEAQRQEMAQTLRELRMNR